MDKETAKNEYAELMQMLRFYGNMRFAVLTVFAALTGGLVAFLGKAAVPLQVMRIGGLIVVLVCWIGEISAVFVWGHFAKRAAKLEESLDYQMYSTMPGAPHFRFLPTTYAIWLLYLLVALFWLVTMARGQ
jgi:hypothetical protein